MVQRSLICQKIKTNMVSHVMTHLGLQYLEKAIYLSAVAPSRSMQNVKSAPGEISVKTQRNICK